MAKKKQVDPEIKREAPVDPLEAVPMFDPKTDQVKETAVAPNHTISSPVSPLGPPTPVPVAVGSLLTFPPQLPHNDEQLQTLKQELAARDALIREQERRIIMLETAVANAKETEDELRQERQTRQTLEREMAALEVEVRQIRQTAQNLEQERAIRLEMERKLATLEVRSERAEQIAEQLVTERDARIRLEREKATLEVQVQSMHKTEALLTEERQARMNAQSRAASAEAQLARLQGEMGQQESGGSLFGRFRGRQ